MAESRLRILLFAIGIFNALDYFFTLQVLQYGFIEANPIMAPVVDTVWFFVIKLVLIPAALYLVWVVRARMGRVAKTSVWICTGAYAGLMGYFGVLMGSGMVL